MLISKEAKVFVNMSKYQYYTEKGYIIETHIDKDKHIRIPRNSYIIVKIEDLPNDSCAIVDIVCDYCGKHISVKYKDFLLRHKKVDKDSCNDCKSLKIAESNIAVYGTNSMIKRAKIQNFKVGRDVKFSNEEIIDYFENRDLTVQTDLLDLSKNILVKDEIPYICKKHINKGVQYISFGALHNRKHCCIYGGNDIRAISQSTSSIDEVKDICNKRNYKLLTKYIRSVDDKIEYICNKHPNYGIQTTSLYGLRKYNHNCRMCRQYSGENHWNWKGGISSLQEHLRLHISSWKRDSLIKYNYTCVITNIKSVDIIIHHVNKNFKDILEEVLTTLNFPIYQEINQYTDDELKSIEDLCLKLHYLYGLGVCICEEEHKLFHSMYGYGNNTPEQFEEFKQLRLLGNQKKDSLLLCSNL